MTRAVEVQQSSRSAENLFNVSSPLVDLDNWFETRYVLAPYFILPDKLTTLPSSGYAQRADIISMIKGRVAHPMTYCVVTKELVREIVRANDPMDIIRQHGLGKIGDFAPFPQSNNVAFNAESVPLHISEMAINLLGTSITRHAAYRAGPFVFHLVIPGGSDALLPEVVRNKLQEIDLAAARQQKIRDTRDAILNGAVSMGRAVVDIGDSFTAPFLFSPPDPIFVEILSFARGTVPDVFADYHRKFQIYFESQLLKPFHDAARRSTDIIRVRQTAINMLSPNQARVAQDVLSDEILRLQNIFTRDLPRRLESVSDGQLLLSELLTWRQSFSGVLLLLQRQWDNMQGWLDRAQWAKTT